MAEYQSTTEPLISATDKAAALDILDDTVLGYANSAEGKEVWGDSAESSDWQVWFWKEAEKQFWLAGPMILVTFMQYAITVISVMLVGHMGELPLASASIATSFAGVTGFSLLIGLSAALETLCGQAYGAKQYDMLGVYLQRASLVLCLACIPITFVWLEMGPLLKALGQDPEISENAGIYARWMIPNLYAYAILQPLVKFLQTQSIVFPMAACSAITVSLHIPLCWLFIFKLGFGFCGAAISAGISQWCNVLLLLIFIKFSPSCKKTWTGFSMEAFRDLKKFFKLAIPSAVMICLEWWTFELIVLLSGLLPNPQLQMSALSICLNTISLIYMIPFGLSAAASTRVSNELGAGRPRAARSAVIVTLSLGICEGLVISGLLFSVRRTWGRAYSSEEEVVDYVATMIPFLATLTVADAVYGVLCGVAKGCGWQAFGAFTNLAAFYVIGLPIVIVLTFICHMNGKGLWIGLICGVGSEATILSIACFFTSWEKQAREATNRVFSTTIPKDGTGMEKEDDK